MLRQGEEREHPGRQGGVGLAATAALLALLVVLVLGRAEAPNGGGSASAASEGSSGVASALSHEGSGSASGGSGREQRLKQLAAASGAITDPALTGATEVSAGAAEEAVAFPFSEPSAPAANASNRRGIFLTGEGVEQTFPPPTETSTSVRQPYISIFESPWTDRDGSPTDAIKEDIAADPDLGKSICEVAGEMGICVEARSPSDAAGANSAYIRFVREGVQYELIGGDSLNVLLEVANSMGAR